MKVEKRGGGRVRVVPSRNQDQVYGTSAHHLRLT